MAKPVNTKNQNALPVRMMTPVFRSSYLHVFKAAQVQGKGDFKFSATMLFDKNGSLVGNAIDDDGKPSVKLSLKDLINNAKINTYGPDKAKWPKGLMSPVSDGDDEKYEDKEGYAGHWIVKATSNAENSPGVVGPDNAAFENPSEFQSGDYARAVIFARCWDYMGKKGVHLILDHIQKVKTGKRFGGKKAASEVFAPIESDEDSETNSGDEESFM